MQRRRRKGNTLSARCKLPDVVAVQVLYQLCMRRVMVIVLRDEHHFKLRPCRPQVDHLTKFVMGDGATPDADEQAQEQRRGNRRDTWAPGVMGAAHGSS